MPRAVLRILSPAGGEELKSEIGNQQPGQHLDCDNHVCRSGLALGFLSPKNARGGPGSHPISLTHTKHSARNAHLQMTLYVGGGETTEPLRIPPPVIGRAK